MEEELSARPNDGATSRTDENRHKTAAFDAFLQWIADPGNGGDGWQEIDVGRRHMRTGAWLNARTAHEERHADAAFQQGPLPARKRKVCAPTDGTVVDGVDDVG